MNFVVELSPTAETDLERLFDFLLDQANTTEDLDRAQAAKPQLQPCCLSSGRERNRMADGV